MANGGWATRTTTNWFYRNDGGGAFVKIGGGFTTDKGASLFATWVDADDDGWPDLFLTEMVNRIYRNTEGGEFVKLGEDVLVSDRGNWSGCAWGDYDNDGDGRVSERKRLPVQHEGDGALP